jgi:hypothetical protein
MIGQRQGVKILCDKFDGLAPCMGQRIGGFIGNGGNLQGKWRIKRKQKLNALIT